MEDNKSMEEMMEMYESSFRAPRKGEVVAGKVVLVNENEVVVNIGYKADGIIPRSEVSSDPNINPMDIVKEDQEIQVYIVKRDDGDGNVLLSLRRITQLKDWDELEALADKNETINVVTKEAVKGGLIAYYKDVRGFIPASQIALGFVNDLTKYVGQTYEVKILEVNKVKRKVVFSHKEILAALTAEKKAKLWATVKEGDTVQGEVKRITSFGAFVDIGGVDGLVHISEMSWGKIRSPKEVVKIGEIVDVKILSINKDDEKVSLSIKQIKNDPWVVVLDNYKVGDVVSATVVNLTDFGAFVEIEPGLEGLVHISQISKERIEKPSDVLRVGEVVKTAISEINVEDKKIKLSIKDALAKEEVAEEETTEA